MHYNFHNEKYKMSDVGGIKKEQFREYADETKYKNHVDSSRSDQNHYKDMVPDGRDWFAQIREAKEQTKEVTGRAVRKDAVVLCSTVESVPKGWDEDICRSYYDAKADWYSRYLQEKGGADEGCLKSLAVHLDEDTPHATYAWIPMKDGRLQAKNILTRDFLRDLQKDGQNFTFDWIDRWNREHPDRRIELLEEYSVDSGMKHLNETEFKEQKILEHVVEMNDDLDRTRQKIGDLNAKEESLKEETQMAIDAKEEYKQKILDVTQAPSIPSYVEVLKENKSLKEELSIKDRIIDGVKETNQKLQEAVTHWREQATEWKDRFSDISYKLGAKIMVGLGHEKHVENTIKPYPTKDVMRTFKAMEAEFEGIDPKDLRVIPDNESEGKFRVVVKTNDGEYNTIKQGLESKDVADSWRRDFTSGTEAMREGISRGMYVKR